MHVIKLSVACSSLYSMRLPYTYQSALTYPVPPPSTLLGLAANTLAQWERSDPLTALSQVEAATASVAAAVTGPVATAAYMLQSLKVDKGQLGKDTLPRQFAWTGSPMILFWAVRTEEMAGRLLHALPSTAFTIGDSESCAHPLGVELSVHEPNTLSEGQTIRCDTYLPADLVTLQGGTGTQYWVRTRCSGEPNLVPYLFPLVQDEGLLKPTILTGIARRSFRAVQVGSVLLPIM